MSELCSLLRSVNVHFGSKADILGGLRDVRFTPESGHWNSVAKCPLCAKSRHGEAPQRRRFRRAHIRRARVRMCLLVWHPARSVMSAAGCGTSRTNRQSTAGFPTISSIAWRWGVHIHKHKAPQFTRRDQGWSHCSSNKMSAFLQKSGAKFIIAGA